MADQRCKRLTTRRGFKAPCGLLQDHGVHKPYPDGSYCYPRHPFEPEDAAPAPKEQEHSPNCSAGWKVKPGELGHPCNCGVVDEEFRQMDKEPRPISGSSGFTVKQGDEAGARVAGACDWPHSGECQGVKADCIAANRCLKNLPVWPRVSAKEVRGYECEPMAQPGAGGRELPRGTAQQWRMSGEPYPVEVEYRFWTDERAEKFAAHVTKGLEARVGTPEGEVFSDWGHPPSSVSEATLDLICRDVAELPDRDSPEDWPEAMLVTYEELKTIIRERLNEK